MIDLSNPHPVTGLDLAFGPSNIDSLLPKYGEIKNINVNQKFINLFNKWFFNGLSQEDLNSLIAKPGIDKNAALNHVRACMKSFSPKHERKELGCAYLLSLWFE